LRVGELSGSRDFAFDDKLWHGPSLTRTHVSKRRTRVQDACRKGDVTLIV
jgi:hypothetical protein